MATSPYDVQALAEQLAVTFDRPYLHLARPGILGSSGNHLDRRRPREVALVNAALSRMRQHFGWTRLNLVGQSGGGHLVAALMARRTDIDCAVITSGNTAVAQRNQENGWSADITGHADFLDPIDHVQDVARHPPNKVIVLTDPRMPGFRPLCRPPMSKHCAAPACPSTTASCRQPARSATISSCRGVAWPPLPI